MKILILLTGILLAIISPLACNKNYSLGPLPGPTATPTIAPTATCAVIAQPPPTSSGIYWEEAYVASGSNYGSPEYDFELYQTVNGTPDSTSGVTVTGTGISPTALVYGGAYTITGVVYANYYAQGNTEITSGGTYTMTSVTSIGTASATAAMAGYATLASDGSAVTWAGSATTNFLDILSSNYSTSYSSFKCWIPPSPILIPSTAYPSHGSYLVAAERNNYTTSISGGAGIFDVYNLV